MFIQMSSFLTEDADLVYACISGLHRTGTQDLNPGINSVDQEALNQLVTQLPHDRFTEAVRFLVRMNMALLVPNGVCPCGSTRFDVVPNLENSNPPYPEPRDPE